MKNQHPLSKYQWLVVAILALTQFTVVLDFMVMSPLGDLLMKDLQVKPYQFGIVVSSYALAAGLSGFMTAGFADRFDRKRLLVFFLFRIHHWYFVLWARTYLYSIGIGAHLYRYFWRRHVFDCHGHCRRFV